MRIDDPGVGHARRALDGAIVVGREPDGRVWFLDRPQRHAGPGEVEEPPVMGHLVPGPQPLDHLEALEKARHALLALHAEGFVLLLAVPEPRPEDEAPLADDVERRHLLGHVDRVQQRQQEHRGADPHRARLGRQARERRQRLDLLEGRREVVLPHHDEVEPGVASRPHLLDVLAESLDHGHAGWMLLRDDQAEFHGLLRFRGIPRPLRQPPSALSCVNPPRLTRL